MMCLRIVWEPALPTPTRLSCSFVVQIHLMTQTEKPKALPPTRKPRLPTEERSQTRTLAVVEPVRGMNSTSQQAPMRVWLAQTPKELASRTR